jgi:hypothetical protein
MSARDDAYLATQFAMKRHEARVMLRKHMQDRGLLERDGWNIAEVVRQREGKTELVMRPIHLRLPSPDDLECVVAIDDAGSRIESECNGDGAASVPILAR